MAGLFADDAAEASADGGAPPPNDLPAGIVRLPSERVVDGPQVAGEPPWRLLEQRRLDPNRPRSGSYRRTSDFRVSRTDADATPMQTRNGTALGYHDHYDVDGGKRRTILAALVTPADVMENVPMRDLLWRVRFRRKLRPRQVVGDTTYGTVGNVAAVEDAGIRASSPAGLRPPHARGFGKHEFAYDAEADVYRCPGEAVLRPLGAGAPSPSASTRPRRPPATPAR